MYMHTYTYIDVPYAGADPGGDNRQADKGGY